MTIGDVSIQAYLGTLSPSDAEKFKKLPPEEQRRRIGIFMQENGTVPIQTQSKNNLDKTKPINMTGDASIGEIGDEVSFHSSTSVQAPERKIPSYPANMERYVKAILREIREGREGYYDTAQNIQIMIDRIQEGSFTVNPKIKDYIIYQLEEKLKSFPADEVAQATNIDRRNELAQARQNNAQVLTQIQKIVEKIQAAVGKEYEKAGIITALGEGILGDWMGETTGRKEYAEKMSLINQQTTTLMNLQYTLTTSEFQQKAQELLGELLNQEAILEAFKAGEEANLAMGKAYVVIGGATAISAGAVVGALAVGGSVATAIGLSGGAVVKSTMVGAVTSATVAGGSSLALDIVDKETNQTERSEDYTSEEWAKMGKNAGMAAAMGAPGGAAGGAITRTLLGTSLGTGAKIGLDITANAAVGVGLDLAFNGEVTTEGTAMNFGTTTLGAVSAYKGVRVGHAPTSRTKKPTGKPHTESFLADAPIAQQARKATTRTDEPQTEFFGFWKKNKTPVSPEGQVLPREIKNIDNKNIRKLTPETDIKIPENSVILLGRPQKALPLSDILGARPLKDGETVTIGLDREGGNADIKLPVDDESISRNHFSITRRGNDYFIKDTSANGTYFLPPKTIPLSKQIAEVPFNTIFEIGNSKISLKWILEQKPLKNGETIIVGRSKDTHVPISGDNAISGQHMKITRHGDSYFITDLSTNGTTVKYPVIEMGPNAPQKPIAKVASQNNSDEKLVPSQKALDKAKRYREFKGYDDIKYLRERCPHLSDVQLREIFSIDEKHVAYIERIENKYPGLYRVTEASWLHYTPSNNNPHCAWKMHLFSDTAADYRQLADVVIPYLIEHNISHKTIPSHKTPEIMATTSPEQAGKTFTIYPRSKEEMAQVARDLDALIRAHNLTKQGSKISGDAAMGDSGRLFYRYEYISKAYENVIFNDLIDPQNCEKYKLIYSPNRGDGRHLAYDMTDADDPWKNFLKPSGSKAQSPQAQTSAFKNTHKIERTEKVVDGYMDGGRSSKLDEHGNVISSNREIIVVDRTKDRVLNQMISDIKKQTAEMSEIQKIEYLFNYVNQMCGMDPNCPTNFNNWMQYNANKQVLLGDIANNTIPIAICRHRSLLFKVLGDEIGVNVNLQRGCFANQYGHSWNVVITNTGDNYICDTMNNKIIPIQQKFIADLEQYQTVDYEPLYVK